MDPFFVIVIVPSVNTDVYKVIKKNLVVENSIPNQVITGQKCLRKDPKTGGMKMAVVTKVAVQIACKLGAVPWAVKIPIKNTMMVGFDTYHKKMGDRNAPSIGALTCSLDDRCKIIKRNHEIFSQNIAVFMSFWQKNIIFKICTDRR